MAFVPFKNGRPTGQMQPFLPGFIAGKNNSIIASRCSFAGLGLPVAARRSRLNDYQAN
jgi:hypothetical protein